MAKNRTLVPQARQAMENMKNEIAKDMNVNFKQGYNGDLTSREAGSVGGEMVRRMIQQYENNMSHK